MRRAAYLDIDWQLVIPVIVLCIFSLVTLFSIDFVLFRNQLTYFIISFLFFFFFSKSHLKVLQSYGFTIYVVSIIMLVFILILGLETRGATRWLSIFGLQIQFSEILKPFLALSFSSFLVKNGIRFKTFFLTFCLFVPIGFLIYIQPDLGNALIYLLIILFTLLVFGFPVLWFIGGFIPFLLVSPLIWHLLRDYQKQRLLTFINPTYDPLGTSYNAIQSIIAVGSGMFLGKGLSEGTQSGLSFLPERHTDFIFATLSESLGFVGSIAILIAFVLLLYRIFFIFNNSHDYFIKTFTLCAFFVILVQMFVNVGMNIGILPIVGVTLPFVSYGGSSLVANFILLGFLSSIQSDIKKENALEIR